MLLLAGSYITWSLLMFLLQKYYRDDLTFNSYIVAFIHSVISCRCCELVWHIEQSMKLDQFGGDLTIPQYYAISLVLGIFSTTLSCVSIPIKDCTLWSTILLHSSHWCSLYLWKSAVQNSFYQSGELKFQDRI